ncbi:MAG TPA: SDR family NAD(P)-dependent oxidoreductase [Mycobacteriales bacterium]|nr:SDR family NAD(P)-dependent oxidoreductase [Mycobacteriales bacterium]HVW80528.1 SDR family NAD(P)-dependent oxidoreductase [Mycobacteriales bacterium]
MSSERPVALVTGASRGIGKACALALADAGFAVAFTARTAKEGDGRDDSDAGGNVAIEGSLERTAAEVEARGAHALPLVADLLDFGSLEAAVATTLERWHRLDVLVLNAVHTGAGSMLRVLDTPADVFVTKLTANAAAQLVLVRAALPAMLAAGRGRIIAITSYSATHDPTAPVGEGGWGYAYAASKAAFHRLAGHLAVEVGGRGVIAVNVDPGHVMTERMAANAERLGLEGRYEGAPPSAPAAAVAWLATAAEAVELNGQTVNGLKIALERGLHPDWRR